MKVGNRCEVNPGARRGEIMYLGEVKELLPGHWVGVKFDEPLGKMMDQSKVLDTFNVQIDMVDFVAPRTYKLVIFRKQICLQT